MCCIFVLICIVSNVVIVVLLNSDVQPDESGRPTVVYSGSSSSSSLSVRYLAHV